jgi:hypothetical protein
MTKFEGTPTEFLSSILEKYGMNQASEAESQKDILFLILKEQIESKNNKEKLEYLDLINEVIEHFFDDFEQKGMSLTDELMKFRLDFQRWQNFWRELAKSKLERRKPDFKFDTANMWEYCINHLTPDKAIKYLKSELRRFVQTHKYGTKGFELIRNELQKMMADIEVMITHRGQEPEESEEIQDVESTPETKPQDMKQEYFTKRETAKYLKVTEQTLYNWKLQGKLIPIKLGGRVLYPIKTIEEFVAKEKIDTAK